MLPCGMPQGRKNENITEEDTAVKKYQIFLAIVLCELIIMGILLVSAFNQIASSKHRINELKKLTRQLQLTDLSVWTEARYTRNPSQADYFSPFQDFPSSVEHFPAGSLIEPPMRGKK